MKRALVIIALVYLVVYVFPLGVRPLYLPDEARYAEIPREMLESGDWIVPRLNGVRYFEKPPLGYWVTALSILTFGENAFAVRLPSAIAAGLTALIILLLMNRWYGRSPAGPLAAAVYLTSFLVFVVGTANILDSLFTLLLTGALASFFHALLLRRPVARNSFLAVAGVCCGLAFLTKGLLAVAIPAMVAVCFLVSVGRWRDVMRLGWLPSAVALALVSPWAAMIFRSEPDFGRAGGGVARGGRVLDPHNSQHPRPLWYYVPVVLACLALWLPLMGAVISGHRSAHPRNLLVRWTLLWAAAPFVFFSASQGKLAAYILPCIPPLAILIAAGLTDYVERQRLTFQFSLGSWGSALAAFASALFVATSDWPGYGDDEIWKRGLVLAGLGWWGIVAVTVAFAKRPRFRLWAYCCAPVVLMLSAPWVVPRTAEDEHTLRGLFRPDAVAATSTHAVVVADTRTIHAVAWYLKRSDVYVLENGGELAYGLGYGDSRHRLIDTDQLRRWLAADSRDQDIIVVLRERTFSKIAGANVAPTRQTTVSDVVWARFSRDDGATASAGHGGGRHGSRHSRVPELRQLFGLFWPVVSEVGKK